MFMYLNGDGIVVTTNDTSGFSLTYELLQSAGAVYGWPDFAVEQHPTYQMATTEIDRLGGDYGIGIHVLRTTDGLVFKFDQEDMSAPMIAWSPTRFIMPGSGDELNFNLDPNSHRAVSLNVDMMQAAFSVKKAAP
jgi:hypothetical protein